MSAKYTKPGSEEGETVVILRNAANGDPEYAHPGQVLVKFGDGSQHAVERNTLSDFVGQELPPEPPAPEETAAAGKEK